jgi:hypothetical protein
VRVSASEAFTRHVLVSMRRSGTQTHSHRTAKTRRSCVTGMCVQCVCVCVNGWSVFHSCAIILHTRARTYMHSCASDQQACGLCHELAREGEPMSRCSRKCGFYYHEGCLKAFQVCVCECVSVCECVHLYLFSYAYVCVS